jgi:hypothetical protein
LKWLHREIMLSATYRQSSTRSRGESSAGDARGAAGERESATADPDNEWLTRMPLRRLEVEAWRDAMLWISGELDERLAGEPKDLLDVHNRRRTLYGVVKRRELSDVLRLHDFPDPVAHSARRDATTTPLQQLFVLNSPFLRQRSEGLARRLTEEGWRDASQRIGRAYELAFGRTAAEEEVVAALRFLDQAGGDEAARAEAWIQYLQVLLASNELLFVP